MQFYTFLLNQLEFFTYSIYLIWYILVVLQDNNIHCSIIYLTPVFGENIFLLIFLWYHSVNVFELFVCQYLIIIQVLLIIYNLCINFDFDSIIFY